MSQKIAKQLMPHRSDWMIRLAFIATNIVEHILNSVVAQYIVNDCICFSIDTLKDGAYILTNDAGRMWCVAMHSKSSIFPKCNPNITQEDIFCISCQRPTSTLGTFGVDQVGAAQ